MRRMMWGHLLIFAGASAVLVWHRSCAVVREPTIDPHDEEHSLDNRRLFASLVTGVAVVFWAALVEAKQRPLKTEEPEAIGSGLILIESGVDYQRG